MKALQQRYGLSYKDAAHRLYLAEVKSLVAQEKTRSDIVALKRAINEVFGAAVGSIGMVEDESTGTDEGQGHDEGQGQEEEFPWDY